MRRVLLPLLFLLPALSIAAKEKCKVIVTATDDARPYELVIKKVEEDPKNSNLRTKLEDGTFECEIEEDEIEMYSIVDFGEVEEKGHTGRMASFFVEDGSTVKVNFDGNDLTVESDGAEWKKYKLMEDMAEEWKKTRLNELGTENLSEEQSATLWKEYRKWKNHYYVMNPMLSFLLNLNEELQYFHIGNSSIGDMLDVYHQHYEDIYPGHNAHTKILEAENSGLQIQGKKYHDYPAYTMDMEKVQASDYFKDKPTLVICWATWCAPCRKEAKELVPLYEKYRERGLNAFSLAREFKTADDMKAAVEEDQYPWPCLLDLDDEFKIFPRHGVTSSGLLLIDAEGTIVAAGYSPEDIEGKLKELFMEEK